MHATTSLSLALRAVAGLLALLTTAWALVGIAAFLRARFDFLSTTFTIMAVTFTALLWWFAVRGSDPSARARMGKVVLGGMLVGSVGFSIGFFGPLVWTPDANQGPLLGIFVTGPIGFSLGVLATWLRTTWRSSRRAR